jgi:hypothetical protein
MFPATNNKPDEEVTPNPAGKPFKQGSVDFSNHPHPALADASLL